MALFTEEEAKQGNQRLKSWSDTGGLVNNAAAVKIAQDPQAREISFWLSTEEGAPYLKGLHHVSHSEKRSLVEADRVIQHYRASQPLQKDLPGLSEVDAYRAQRAADIKAGKRRR